VSGDRTSTSVNRCHSPGLGAASTDAIDTATVAFHYDGNGCRVTTVGVAHLVIFGVLEENEEGEIKYKYQGIQTAATTENHPCGRGNSTINDALRR